VDAIYQIECISETQTTRTFTKCALNVSLLILKYQELLIMSAGMPFISGNA